MLFVSDLLSTTVACEQVAPYRYFMSICNVCTGKNLRAQVNCSYGMLRAVALCARACIKLKSSGTVLFSTTVHSMIVICSKNRQLVYYLLFISSYPNDNHSDEIYHTAQNFEGVNFGVTTPSMY